MNRNTLLTSNQLDSKFSAKHFRVTDITYSNNSQSNYTERMEQLYKSFDYENDQDCYWSKPEFSLLYGTPLYQEASPAQKLALNHLYWAIKYSYTAMNEASGLVYFQITAGVFNRIKGYEKLCQEINLETEQEKVHIKAFQKISSKTKIAILGKKTLLQSIPDNISKKWDLLSSTWINNFQSNQFIKYLSQKIFHSKARYYSSYLQNLEQQNKPLQGLGNGVYKVTIPQPLMNLVALHWGSSPFLACHYYSFRYTANLSLKNYEYPYFKFYKKLEKYQDYIPVPTATSYYHFLDESFHTTMSQVIARDMYKDFPAPNNYEKIFANWITYRMQQGYLNSVSGCVPSVFRDDSFFIPFFYRILRSPVFEMSKDEALHWIEKCCCQEHDGFQENLKNHQILLSEQIRFYSQLDYMYLVNREMKIMAAGASIKKAIKSNTKSLKVFRELLSKQEKT